MKKIFLFLLVSILTFGQEDPNMTGEFNIELINRGSSWNVTFEVTAVTERWDENYYLTDEYDNPFITLVSPWQTYAYFDLILDNFPGTNPVVALGKYKVKAMEGGVESAWFYMDWRSSDNEYGCPDVEFKYDVINNRFRDQANTKTINSTTQTWWELVGDIEQITTGLELYLSVSNQNANPYLTWNAYHDSNILGYNIYKKITLGAGGSQTYTIFTTSTSYLDEDFEINPRFGEDVVEYWIKAKISSSQVSLEGNHIQLKGDSYIQWKVSDQETNKDLDYNLYQNYPNPFNPSTIINYQLIEDDFVNLSIYNSVGEIVAELVNQQQERGYYSIEFDASNLPSGVYFYKIKSNNFSDVKKMILLR